jgi:hypothetical protein
LLRFPFLVVSLVIGVIRVISPVGRFGFIGTTQPIPTQDSGIYQEHLGKVVVGRYGTTNMRQEHDEDNEGEFDHSGRCVDEQTLFQVLYEWSLEYQMEMGRLQAHESTQQVQGLYAILLLYKKFVEGNKQRLGRSVMASAR